MWLCVRPTYVTYVFRTLKVRLVYRYMDETKCYNFVRAIRMQYSWAFTLDFYRLLSRNRDRKQPSVLGLISRCLESCTVVGIQL